MPPRPPSSPKKFFLAAAWLKNFFQDRLPPKQKVPDRTLAQLSLKLPPIGQNIRLVA